MSNLEIYEAVRTVPDNAKKEIQAGRLKGFTDINAMWRIKTLTEMFGVCGFGWKTEIIKQWIEPTDTNTIVAFVNINLYIKYNGEWSEPIPATGGSKLMSREKEYLYTNDECYKMALTDAIGGACKMLGFGADVYWNKDSSKYDIPPESPKSSTQPPQNAPKQSGQPNSGTISEAQTKRIYAISKGNAQLCKDIISKYGYSKSAEVKNTDYNKICAEIEYIANGGKDGDFEEINTGGDSA